MKYLKFSLRGQPYALDLGLVSEILLLPELTPIPDAPADVIGVIDRRGEILPVIHLGKRLGISQPYCSITDNLIVFNWQNHTLGLVVEQVEDVIEIFQTDPLSREIQPPLSLFVESILRWENELISVVSPSSLVRSPLTDLEGEADPENFYTRFVPNATTREQAIFYQRRLDLAKVNTQEQDYSSPFALVEVGQTMIALPLEQVREFVDISEPVPIPFSPEFVVGNVGVRGEIITLLSLSQLLGLPQSKERQNQAVVTEFNQTTLGIGIDRVRDVVTLSLEDLHSSAGEKQGILGTKLVGGSVVEVIDLEKVFSQFLKPRQTN